LWLPAAYPAAWVLKALRRKGLHKLPLCKRALLQVGVFPIRNHYYEPLFDFSGLRRPLDEDRSLPGIDWNVTGQLALLQSFRHQNELREIPTRKVDELSFHFNNGAFDGGDAEFLYQLIRSKKPARIFEIGSGKSTQMALRAIGANCAEDRSYRCRQVCIEPYEAPWLERAGVEVIRRRVEEVGTALFDELGSGDLLFIDSSHIIRPQGDVLFEYLELLPRLRAGVIVHLHDIFSPRDYLRSWIVDEVRLWNEQYLLEAFLTGNREWRVIGALNFLHHHHATALREKCPFLAPEHEPGSFYIEKVAQGAARTP
jgi:predicted O-methyltransferase YrrM